LANQPSFFLSPIILFFIFFFYSIKTAAARPRKESNAAPESFLKKRQSQEKRAAHIATKSAKRTAKRSATKKEIFKRAEKYVAEYRSQEKNDIRMKRVAKANNQFYVPSETKVVLVVRILGTYGVSPKVRKILQLLRLRQLNNASFVRVNKATTNMLIQVSPYITWGSVTVKTVRDLVYKRGYAKLSGKRVALTDNAIIEKVLGRYGIICMEDLVHEIATCGPHFKNVNSFLWPFKLNTPNGGFVAKKIGFNEGGDAGDRKDINAFVAKMI